MADHQELEGLFLQNLERVERVAAALCRRHALSSDEADDFTSWIKLRLVEDDYAAFRKFRGESSLATYLTVVVGKLFRDYRVSQWGRWRPSAEARRRGPLAMRLETLVHRDGYTLGQAAQVLRASGATDLSDRELAVLLDGLPTRAPQRRTVGAEALEEIPAAASAEDLVLSREAEEQRSAAHQALQRAMERLPSEDRLILHMQYFEGLTVADIARGLRLPQKPLYRRIPRALNRLRKDLEAAGVTRDRVRGIMRELLP